jgi:antitoxin YefM
VRKIVPTETTDVHARARFTSLCDEVTSTREAVIIHRRTGEDVALIAAAELTGLMETAHLLRSPKNARRLVRALARAQTGALPTQTVESLRRESNL